MNEPLVDIVAVPDHPRGLWRAVAADGTVAGVARLRPIMPLGQDFLPPAASVPTAGELTLYVEPQWRRGGIGSRLLAAVRAHTAEPRLVTDVAPASPGAARRPDDT